MWDLKNKTNYRISQKRNRTHRYREQTSGYQWGEGKGEGKVRELRGTNYYVSNK